MGVCGTILALCLHVTSSKPYSPLRRALLLAATAALATGAPSSARAQFTGSQAASVDLPAFPGAEGFGAVATGGRGGKVIKVTTLDASGPGSLAEALSTSGPRIVVFEVSGVIDAGLLEIPEGNLTIAGQTAPGAGITIRGRLYAAYESGVDNIIIRHIRVRPREFTGGAGETFDAVQFSLSKKLIFDHVSIAFGVDENMDLYEADQVTVQWSTIEESATQGHPEGEHNYGLIQGEDGYEISLHHNLFVHHKNRTPAVANGPAEIRNNVSYNCRQGFVHNNNASGHINIVGNYYRRGPSDQMFPFYFDYEEAGPNLGYYLQDNYIDDPGLFEGSVDNPWKRPLAHPAFDILELDEDGSSEQFRASTAFALAEETSSPHVPVTTQSAQDAYELVLDHAGAFPRDSVTARDVRETRERTGMWGARMPADYMLGLTPGEAPVDSDDDGMPDVWEQDHGLDSADGSDHNEVMSSGYTAIEEYINEVADDLSGTPDAPGVDDPRPGEGTPEGEDSATPDLVGGCQSSGSGTGPLGLLALGLLGLVASLRRRTR